MPSPMMLYLTVPYQLASLSSAAEMRLRSSFEYRGVEVTISHPPEPAFDIVSALLGGFVGIGETPESLLAVEASSKPLL